LKKIIRKYMEGNHHIEEQTTEFEHKERGAIIIWYLWSCFIVGLGTAKYLGTPQFETTVFFFFLGIWIELVFGRINS